MKKPIPTRAASKRQETKVAKLLGGKVQPNSGATDYSKGDVTTDEMLLECKTSMKSKQSFSIKKEWLDKNEIERFSMKKDYSGLVFDFGDNGKQYIVMEMSQFKRLLSERKQED